MDGGAYVHSQVAQAILFLTPERCPEHTQHTGLSICCRLAPVQRVPSSAANELRRGTRRRAVLVRGTRMGRIQRSLQDGQFVRLSDKTLINYTPTVRRPSRAELPMTGSDEAEASGSETQRRVQTALANQAAGSESLRPNLSPHQFSSTAHLIFHNSPRQIYCEMESSTKFKWIIAWTNIRA